MTPESLAAPESQVVAVEPARLAPIDAAERIASIDVLRGVALLGILTIADLLADLSHASGRATDGVSRNDS